MKAKPILRQAALALALALLIAAPAAAELTVTIDSIVPGSELADGDLATISWTIETDGESGIYRVEIDGDGAPESGRLIAASDGYGEFNGDYSDSSTIQTDEDLVNGDGEYIVYVIAESDESGDDDDDDDYDEYASASTKLTLQNVPYAPLGLSAEAGDARLFLRWEEHDDRDLNYTNIYYGTSPGDFTGTGANGGDSPIEAAVGSEYNLEGLENDITYYVRITVVDDFGEESELSNEVSGKPVTVSGMSGLSGENGDCFVATAAFGDYDSAQVVVLRQFRERVLRPSAAGRALIRLYAQHGPTAAALISGSAALRMAARSLLQPLVGLAWITMRPLLLVILLILLTAMLAARRFSYRRIS
ncbi:MAG: fibronectin type III domain-containing protein [Candidatus Alcyoniella australis]|nr:fibronectin type III domain-containing protein [Candidatus Alcyoniella australis]